MVDQNTQGQTSEEQLFTQAIAVANIPTLLMTLVQLTGEMHWMQEPYRPKRASGMSDNDTGGLSETAQGEIREAALEAILAWRAGRPVAIVEPSEELLVEMLSCAMAEKVPAEYGAMTAAQLGKRPVEQTPIENLPEGFKVLIIGAGVSGICAAVNLQAAKVPYIHVEKHTSVGGTWYENRYPGAGVDTPNHLYSFSFSTYDWTKYFALRDELYSYLNHVADEFNLKPAIQFNTAVASVVYDTERQVWDATLRGGDGSVETVSAMRCAAGFGELAGSADARNACVCAGI